MRKVGSDAGSVDDIVERELADFRVGLAEKGEGLANASSGSENSDLDLFDAKRINRK